MKLKFAFTSVASSLFLGCALQMIPTTVCEPGVQKKISNTILIVEAPESNALKELKSKLETKILASFETNGHKLHLYTPTSIKLNTNGLNDLVEKTNADFILSVNITNATFNGGSLNYVKVVADLYDISRKTEIWKTEMSGNDMTLFEHEKHFSEEITRTLITELKKNNLL